MNLWKNKWKAELDKATPPLRSAVTNQPANVLPSESNAKSKQVNVPVYKRKPFWYCMSSVTAVLLVVVLCATLIPSAMPIVYAMVVEVNPAVTFTADAQGRVTGVIASNADADVILSDVGFVSQLKGKPLDQAVRLYVDRTVMLGYLDADNVSAVRLTLTGDGGKLLSKASDALEGYFMERGIKSIVVADSADLVAFAERSGLNSAEDVNALVAQANSLDPVFRNRGAESLSKTELKTAYADYVSSDAFAQSVIGYLNGLIDLIEQNEQDVNRLADLNGQIVNHRGNPASMFKDYWSVKAFYNVYDDAEFAELMARMDKSLEAYKSTYGQEIGSVGKLDSLCRIYEAVSASDLRQILSDFDSELLKSNLEWLSQLIEVVAVNSPLVGLTTLPETATEYIGKMRDALTLERDSRQRQFEQAYNAVRDSFSASDYDAFKQSLLEEYGSPNDVWNNLK